MQKEPPLGRFPRNPRGRALVEGIPGVFRWRVGLSPSASPDSTAANVSRPPRLRHVPIAHTTRHDTTRHSPCPLLITRHSPHGAPVDSHAHRSSLHGHLSTIYSGRRLRLPCRTAHSTTPPPAQSYISYRQLSSTISSVTPPLMTFAICSASPESSRLFSRSTSHRYAVMVRANRKAQPMRVPKAA